MITIHPTQPHEAQTLITIQKAAFFPLWERYRDAGNPHLRGVDDILRRLEHPFWRYFTICEDETIVGGIAYKLAGRTDFYDPLPEGMIYLGRLYIDPAHQNRSIAQTAITLSEHTFPNARSFAVDFPEDLSMNRRCYEKAGFRDTGMRFEVQPGELPQQRRLVLACFGKQIG